MEGRGVSPVQPGRDARRSTVKHRFLTHFALLGGFGMTWILGLS